MNAHVEVNAAPADPAFVEQFIQDELVNWITGEDGIVAKEFAAHGFENPWAPLKESTIKDKLRKGYSPQADQTRTGKLQADARNPAIEFEPGRVTFTIPQGQNPYAAAHQYGSMGTQRRQLTATLKITAGRRKYTGPVRIGAQMPPRPPLPVPSPERCAHFGQELGEKLLRLQGF